MKKVGMGEIIFFGVCLTKQCMIIFGMRVTGMGGGGGGRGGWGKCLIWLNGTMVSRGTKGKSGMLQWSIPFCLLLQILSSPFTLWLWIGGGGGGGGYGGGGGGKISSVKWKSKVHESWLNLFVCSDFLSFCTYTRTITRLWRKRRVWWSWRWRRMGWWSKLGFDLLARSVPYRLRV